MICNWFCEAIIFALYIFVCLSLLKPRFSVIKCVPVYAAAVLCSGAVSAALALSGNGMAALTLLPLTAYLPISICVYALSEGGIFEAAAACSVSALAALIVKTFKKILPWFIMTHTDLKGLVFDIVIAVTVLVLAAAAAFVVFRFMRGNFGVCADSDVKNRLLVIIPTATVFLMIFNNFNSTSTTASLIMTLVIAVSFFTIAARLLYYSARNAELAEHEKKLSESLELQRKNFELLSQSVEAGRHYRHDMRHHLKVLSGMAQQNDSEEILGYIGNISSSAELCEPELCCKNSAVNAVVSEYISRAKKLGFQIEYKIFIPEELPFELPDVCIILSNALENALNSCEKCPEDKRYIDLLADFSDERKLIVSVSNSCADIVEIDAEGLPIVGKRTDGHGIGLRGVNKVVKKYNGFLCCECRDGEFVFCAVIFRDQSGSPLSGEKKDHKPKRSKALPAVLTSLVCTVGLLNASPASASALSDVLSINVKTISYGWGDNNFYARYPEFSGENAGELNMAAEDFINEAENIFRRYAIQKYEGYVSEDSRYQIMLDNESYLSVRFYATLNVGGSVDLSRCVTVDKRENKTLALSDLFGANYDYIGKISAEVLRQMEFRVQHENANYFIPGGIWSDDECFKEISPEQDFYLNADGQLVIVFEEYTVAPGSEGSPEFVMPYYIFRS